MATNSDPQTAQDPPTSPDGEQALSGQLARSWDIAQEIADQVQRRWPAEIVAIGVHGPLAHNDDRDGDDVDVVAVTYRSGQGPTTTSRRINGVIVDIVSIGADDYVSHARTISTRWPLIADQYLNTKPLFDHSGWHGQLRDIHLGRLAEASGREFAALARESWCNAASLLDRAIKATEWYDTDGALLQMAEARTATAVTEGLLTRTYFRSSADAARRTDLSGADVGELRSRMARQAEELAKRGRPVDGDVSDLFR